MRPGFDGKMEIAGDTVQNPFGRRGEMEAVAKNVRESSLTTMHARGQIDDAQLMAGEWYRGKYEKMRMGSGAIDPSYEPVDTSGHADPIPDRLIMASQALRKAREAVDVGAQAWLLIELICGQGHTVMEAANRRYGLCTRAQLTFTGQSFREALDALATYLGYAQTKPRTQNVVDKRRA